MSKEKRIPKEYAIVVSLIIFFTIVILTGAVRVYLITKDRLDTVDLSSIDVLETDTNIDIASYNLKISNSIRQKYDIDVYYGVSVNAESVNAVPATDDSLVFDMLRKINTVLEEYPEDLIREIEKRGYEISIHIVDHFTNNVEALANRNSIGQMKIYISNTTDVRRALHHEFYHILDYYIRLEFDESIAYMNWNIYNPIGFEYPEDVHGITSEHIYNGEKGAHFVTAYAKYSDKEDRAETFAEMITAPRDEAFFDENEPIKGKMNIIKRVLRSTFESMRFADNLAWE